MTSQQIVIMPLLYLLLIVPPEADPEPSSPHGTCYETTPGDRYLRRPNPW